MTKQIQSISRLKRDVQAIEVANLAFRKTLQSLVIKNCNDCVDYHGKRKTKKQLIDEYLTKDCSLFFDETSNSKELPNNRGVRNLPMKKPAWVNTQALSYFLSRNIIAENVYSCSLNLIYQNWRILWVSK